MGNSMFYFCFFSHKKIKKAEQSFEGGKFFDKKLNLEETYVSTGEILLNFQAQKLIGRLIDA